MVCEYLDMIRLYLVDMINDHKLKAKWKIQLTAVIDFISSKPDSDETHITHTKSDNIKIMIGSETNEVTEELSESVLQRYHERLEDAMKRSGFVFDSVNALHYDLSKTSLNRDGSYIESPKWLENKKATLNPKKDDDKCFQYVLTAVLN